MAKSIALTYDMQGIVLTDGTSKTELSLENNGIKVEIANEQLSVTAAADIATGSSDQYSTLNAQYTVTFNEANNKLGVIGIEDLLAGGKSTGGVYGLSGASFNIRLVGTNIVVQQY